jgi:ureidoglycolate hydrolase
MDENLLVIREHAGEGYQPLVTFGDWRVAVLRYLDDINPENINSMERHNQTDEVFVLIQGCGVLIIGGNGPQVEGIYPQVMQAGKIYNVRRGTWHTIILTLDASVLIVENEDTGEDNSQYTPISVELHRQIVALARQENIDLQSTDR